MAAAPLEFLAEGNICGQTLLRLVSRGSAIIAELFRLSSHTPACLLAADESLGPVAAEAAAADPTALKYRPVLFDFKYLKTPEMYDRPINTSVELAELDEEMWLTHAEVLTRFMTLLESIVGYCADFARFLRELNEGFYISHTLEGALLDTSGKQLLCEALYLQGVMMLLLDQRVPGPVRERTVVAVLRHRGEAAGSVPLDEVVKLARDTGFRPSNPAARRPPSYPEDYLTRFPVDAKAVGMILARLRSDDVYLTCRVYPDPEHRSTALSAQASLIYVCLYFAPAILREGKAAMREIVDKHFPDNWVVPIYMGTCADLSVEWERYKAAKEALGMDALTPAHVKALTAGHREAVAATWNAVSGYLREGVLSETFVVDNAPALLETIRRANVSLRWALLHRRTETKKWRDIVNAPAAGFAEKAPLLDFLLRTSLLEYRLKAHIRHLLAGKAGRWAEGREYVGGILGELSLFFSGERALTRVERDEGLRDWFKRLQSEVTSLDYEDGVLAGRKIAEMMRALEEVTAFEVVDSTPQVKEYLTAARERLTEMVRSVAISETTEADLTKLADFSYAWEAMREFVPDMHAAIEASPGAVQPLRALFLKLTSVLDVPLTRVVEARSRDAESVAEYYSSQLVAFLRRVLAVIPAIVFAKLGEVIALQSTDIRPMPATVEAAMLRDFAAHEARARLARRTADIATFTEGVLAMEKTLLGVIRVDPRHILTEGIRSQLVERMGDALHRRLAFDTRPARGRDPKSSVEGALTSLRDSLGSIRSSLEFVQDYIRLPGLRMWQEEYTRLVGFAVEQEANRFTRRRVLPEASRFWSAAVPLPGYLLGRPPPGDASPAHCVTFMGRLLEALCALTHPSRTSYGPGAAGGSWYDVLTGREIAGPRLLSLVKAAVGVQGLTGLDKLLGFTAERELRRMLRLYAGELAAGASELLGRLGEELAPSSAVSPAMAKSLWAFAGRLRKPLDVTQDAVVATGAAQLLRRACTSELRFAARLDSNLLFGAAGALNDALLADLRAAFRAPEEEGRALPSDSNPLLADVARQVEAVGTSDPLASIYLTVEARLLPGMGLWLLLLALHVAPKLAWDREVGCLLPRKGKAGETPSGLDGGPFVAGFSTLLRQMHPAVTEDWLAHTGQFLRAALHATVGQAVAEADGGSSSARKELAKAPPSISPDVLTFLQLTVLVARTAHVPARVLRAHVPAWIVDTISSATPAS